MKRILVSAAITLLAIQSNGQYLNERKKQEAMDSIKAKYIQELAWKVPILRQAGISTEVVAPGEIDSKLYGKSFFDGKYQFTRTKAFLNLPIFQFGANAFSGGFAVGYEVIELYDITTDEPPPNMAAVQTHNTQVSGSITYTRSDSLFHRPIILLATTAIVTNPVDGLYRMSGSGMFSMRLRQTQRSSFSIGMVFILDPSAPLPAIPFVSYQYSFKKDLQFSLGLTGVSLRKEVNDRTAVAIVNTMGGNLSLFNKSATNFPDTQTFSTLELKSGIVYEHLFANNIVFSASAGANTTLTSKVIDGRSFDDPFMENRQSVVPYLKIGLTVLPFLTKPLIKNRSK